MRLNMSLRWNLADLSETPFDLTPETLRTLPTMLRSDRVVPRVPVNRTWALLGRLDPSVRHSTLSIVPTGAWTLRSTPVRKLSPIRSSCLVLLTVACRLVACRLIRILRPWVRLVSLLAVPRRVVACV